MPEDGAGSRKPPMAREREIESTADAISGDGGIDRRWILLDREHQSLSHLRERVSASSIERGNFSKICSDGEKGIVSGDDQRTAPLGQFEHSLAKSENAISSESIGSVRGSKTQNRRALMFVEMKKICRQANPKT